MAGLLIDAYKLNKSTKDIRSKLEFILSKRLGSDSIKELKTKRFIDGADGWSRVIPGPERMQLIQEICEQVTEIASIYAIGVSFGEFEKQKNKTPLNTYWLASGMYICSLLQKKMQRLGNNKGLTVLIFDQNEREEENLSRHLHKKDQWFDGLYQKNKKSKWLNLKEEERFHCIIDTSFSVKSEHSPWIQAADIVCYVYRRWLELFTQEGKYEGEKEIYDALVTRLDTRRQSLGRCHGSECVNFYQQTKHPKWEL